MDSVEKSTKSYDKNSVFIKERFTIGNGIPLIIFGERLSKERFVILTMKDFFRLTRLLLKGQNKTS
ncbi:hypothetical protein BU251_02770 [Candidatus Velamenicoccus archaeovorus]|uniref:Uncharacterized protein n=1 Tax=Velamenicoccus archaeovorus TaxID=1930593 RepID=A0A410P3M8_VELA1|nr:hypothetical protein BU251_02770 [Candidatus Velamenicoccus archaeovorus]